LPISPKTILSVLHSENNKADVEHQAKLSEGIYDYTDTIMEPLKSSINGIDQKVLIRLHEKQAKADFKVTLSDEQNVIFKVHKKLLRTESEYFDGILEDESDRTFIELNSEHFQCTSGDIELFFDILYHKKELYSLAPNVLVQQAKIGHFFYATAFLSQCEKLLIHSASPRTSVRRLASVRTSPRGYSPSSRGSSMYISPMLSRRSKSPRLSAVQQNSESGDVPVRSPSLSSLKLADSLALNDLKQSCINDLTNQGYSQLKNSPELEEALNSLSKDTLTSMLTAVIEKNY